MATMVPGKKDYGMIPVKKVKEPFKTCAACTTPGKCKAAEKCAIKAKAAM